MKKIMVLILACFWCCNEQSNGINNTDNLFIRWSLIKIQSGFSEPEVFLNGELIWKFSEDNILEIFINKEIDETSGVPFPEGKYDFLLDLDTIKILDTEYDYYFRDGFLYLGDDVSSDGPLLTFEPKQ